MRSGDRFRLGAAVALELGFPAKANKGLSSLSGNHPASFLSVTGLGSGAYFAKQLPRQRCE
jgi:hypothetical protein